MLPEPLLLVLLVGGSAVLSANVLWLRLRDQRRRDRDRLHFELRFPRELEAERVEAFLGALQGMPISKHLYAGESTVAFELFAQRGAIRHRLRLPRGQAPFVLAQLRALIPRVGITEIADPFPQPARGVELRLTNRARELRVVNPAMAAASLLAASQPLGRDEAIVAQWLVAPSVSAPVSAARAHSLAGSGVGLLSGKEAKPDPEKLKAARDKASAPLFRAVGRIGVLAASRERQGHLLWRMTGALQSLRQPGVSLRARWLPITFVSRRLMSAATPILAYPCRLNARELACVIAWPIESPQIAELAIGGGRNLVPDPALPRVGRIIGLATFPGAERPVAVSVVDALHHLAVTGPTGTGKSTLLGALALGDIRAGRGVVVIDPKGDLVADLLDRIPAEAADRVVVLDPTDDERPVGLNLLQGAHDAPELVTDQVIAIFHQMYEAFWGPRTQDVLHASLLTLAAEPGQTLCELPRLLTNDAFRRRLLARVDDPIALGPFWAWYDHIKPGERAQAIGPVMNKLRPLLLRRRVRNVIGQAEPRFAINQVLSESKVLLVSLAKGVLGPEAASLIGSLVIAQLWQAIQARAAIPQSRREPVFVYADEFQTYVALPTDMADVLAQARGLQVGVVLAHQHLGQLPASLRQAVAANARSRVVFQSAADDAKALARQLGGGLTAEDLQDLPAYQAYAALFAGGRVRPPVSLRTFPLPDPLGTASQVRRLSRERYGVDRTEIEAAMQRRHQTPLDDGPVGRIGRQP